MEETNRKPLAEFYISRWTACLPLLVMIAPAIVLSFMGVLSSSVMIAGGVVGLMVGSLFAREKRSYWNQVTDSLADRTGLLVFALFLIVGIYGKLLIAGQLAEGLIWLSGQMNIGPVLFLLFVYIVCSVLGTAMGTSLGIVIIMTPVLYPAAVALGADPVLAAGAILSGAATGDHFAPVSDTTIISSSTQRYKTKPGAAEVGEVVKARLIYAIPAFAISCILYLLAGSMTAQPPLEEANNLMVNGSPNGLIMLVPMLGVIVAAISGRTVFEALTYGTFAGLLIALAFGLIGPGQVLAIEGREPTGILIEGAVQNLDSVVMILLMMGCYGVMRSAGLLDTIVSALQKSTAKTVRATELTMFGVGWLLNFLLVGLVARITVVAGPIFDALGQSQNLHPCRRANILDAVANSFSFVVPWHLWPLFMIMTIEPLMEVYPFLTVPAPTDFISSTFYPLVIWSIMLVSIITGFGRTFETPLPIKHKGEWDKTGANR